jgi:hypothetical protein
MDAWREGQDGRDPTYREWLYPPPLLVIIVLGLATLVGVAYGGALTAIGMTLLAISSTHVRVDDRVVRAGRARLPLAAIADAVPLDAEGMRHARRHGDPRDYLVLRAWSSRRGVAIRLDDPSDPHPRWVVSTRHPDRLATAINGAIAESRTPPDAPG